MPIDSNDLEDLEGLLSGQDIDLPVNKKSGFHRNISKVKWVFENFDTRNLQHEDREEIISLCEKILLDAGMLKG
jgi:hypothetical protein